MKVYVFELIQKQKMLNITPEEQKFLAKMIVKEVEQAAFETGKTAEEVYMWYAKGLYGSDRMIDVDFINEDNWI